jgi:hypothetical protein
LLPKILKKYSNVKCAKKKIGPVYPYIPFSGWKGLHLLQKLRQNIKAAKAARYKT